MLPEVVCVAPLNRTRSPALVAATLASAAVLPTSWGTVYMVLGFSAPA